MSEGETLEMLVVSDERLLKLHQNDVVFRAIFEAARQNGFSNRQFLIEVVVAMAQAKNECMKDLTERVRTSIEPFIFKPKESQ